MLVELEFRRECVSLMEHGSDDGWEMYAKQLLLPRYRVASRPVFDRDRQDWGIEGSVAADAPVFRCFSVERHRDVTDLHEVRGL